MHYLPYDQLALHRCYVSHNFKAGLPPAKRLLLFYFVFFYDVHSFEVLWNQTHSIFKASLYIYTFFYFPSLVYHCRTVSTSIREISVLWEVEIVNTHPSTENRMNRDKHKEYISFFIRFREKMIYFSFNEWKAKNILDSLFLLVSKHNS